MGTSNSEGQMSKKCSIFNAQCYMIVRETGASSGRLFIFAGLFPIAEKDVQVRIGTIGVF